MKKNKYEDMVNELNKSFLNEILELGEKTIAEMNKAKLLYSPAGAQSEISRIYKEALEEAERLKDEHVKNLNYKLQVARAEIEQGRENYNSKTNEEKILIELQKLNGFNSFSTQLASMETQEILNLAQDEYLSEQKAGLIRKELSARATAQEDSGLLVQSRTIKATTASDLIQYAQEMVNTYSNGTVFPGLSISQNLQGGVEKILGQDLVNKFNSDYFFGEGGDIE